MDILTYLRTHLAVARTRLHRDVEGASMVEYGLLVALIAVVVIAALTPLGQGIANLFTDVNNNLPAGGTGTA